MNVPGWPAVDQIEGLDVDAPVPDDLVQGAVDHIERVMNENLADLRKLLRQHRLHDLAHALGGQWSRRPEDFWGGCFASGAVSHRMPVQDNTRADVRRCVFILHLCFEFIAQTVVIMRGTPSATLVSEKDNQSLTRVVRHMTLRALCKTLKYALQDTHHFMTLTRQLLGEDNAGISMRTAYWPFDAELLPEQLLMGCLPTQNPAHLNVGLLNSPTVAAAVLRTFVESTLFRRDFLSSFYQSVQAARGQRAAQDTPETWEDARDALVDDGLLTEAEGGWISMTYRILCAAVHAGATLTHGEVLGYTRLTRLLRDRIVKRSGGTFEAIRINIRQED